MMFCPSRLDLVEWIRYGHYRSLQLVHLSTGRTCFRGLCRGSSVDHCWIRDLGRPRPGFLCRISNPGLVAPPVWPPSGDTEQYCWFSSSQLLISTAPPPQPGSEPGWLYPCRRLLLDHNNYGQWTSPQRQWLLVQFLRPPMQWLYHRHYDSHYGGYLYDDDNHQNGDEEVFHHGEAHQGVDCTTWAV